MIIPEKFAQFKKQNALLLISGKQEMAVYLLKDGEINEERHFTIPNATYSDNEGHFKVRSGGKVIRSGSVREVDDRKIIDKFKAEVVTVLSEVGFDFDQVFISAPGKTKNELLSLLSPEMSEKVTKTVEGNYCSLPAVDILSVFSNGKEDSEDTLSNAEARKILSKDNQR